MCGYWSVSLCVGVGGSGGAGGTIGVRGANGVVSGSGGGVGGGGGDSEGGGGVGGGCVFWVISGLSGGGFVVVVVWEDFGLVLWSGWRMALWCWNGRGDFLRRFSLKSVAVLNCFTVLNCRGRGWNYIEGGRRSYLKSLKLGEVGWVGGGGQNKMVLWNFANLTLKYGVIH